MKQKKAIIIAAVSLVVVGALAAYLLLFKGNDQQAQVKPTPEPEPVNIIPVSERPYVTLAPLSGRNQLEFVIHDLKTDADEVEVVLEYDRNEGVMDAVLRTFQLSKIPYTESLFLGSKSAGGHITYHDDVIGGTLRLEFSGEEDYVLEVPWRYDDEQPSYTEFSTADGKFQVELEDPIRSQKIVAMQSPGLPENIEAEVLAGPYLLRGVGELPDTTAAVTIRLTDASDTATILGWDGEEWQELDTTVDGRSVSANADLYQVYIVR